MISGKCCRKNQFLEDSSGPIEEMEMREDMKQELRLDAKGLVPAVVQDYETNQVLMLGYISPDSLKKTLEGDHVWFYSRSRKNLWLKGETSGNYLKLKSISIDCDRDTLLLKVAPVGPTCHTGQWTCFFTELGDLPVAILPDPDPGILDEIYDVIKDRIGNPVANSYTTELLQSGISRIAQKVVEEAGETAISAVERDKEGMTKEVADLFYHALVLLASLDVSPEMVWRELRVRRSNNDRVD